VPWLDAKALETDREGLAFLRSVLEGARPCPSDVVYGPPSRASREAARRTKRPWLAGTGAGAERKPNRYWAWHPPAEMEQL
jgi:hypothetical protein